MSAPDAPLFAELEQLVEAAERLERHPQYRVLETLAWEQALASKANAPRVDLPAAPLGDDAPVPGARSFAVNGFARQSTLKRSRCPFRRAFRDLAARGYPGSQTDHQ